MSGGVRIGCGVCRASGAWNTEKPKKGFIDNVQSLKCIMK